MPKMGLSALKVVSLGRSPQSTPATGISTAASPTIAKNAARVADLWPPLAKNGIRAPSTASDR